MVVRVRGTAPAMIRLLQPDHRMQAILLDIFPPKQLPLLIPTTIKDHLWPHHISLQQHTRHRGINRQGTNLRLPLLMLLTVLLHSQPTHLLVLYLAFPARRLCLHDKVSEHYGSYWASWVEC